MAIIILRDEEMSYLWKIHHFEKILITRNESIDFIRGKIKG